MILLIALLLIGLEAVYEALRDTGSENKSYDYEFAHRLIVALTFAGITQLPFLREHRPVILLIGYVFVRFALFDLIYNAVHGGIPLDYIGTTKRWDRFLRSLKLHPTLLLFARGIALIWGSSWLLGWKDGIIDWAKHILI